MAHTKAGGSTRNGRDSAGKRLGVKLYGGMAARSGNIIVRQRGSKMLTGPGTAMGIDHTIFATVDGIVTFSQRNTQSFTGHKSRHTVVSVQTQAA